VAWSRRWLGNCHKQSYKNKHIYRMKKLPLIVAATALSALGVGGYFWKTGGLSSQQSAQPSSQQSAQPSAKTAADAAAQAAPSASPGGSAVRPAGGPGGSGGPGGGGPGGPGGPAAVEVIKVQAQDLQDDALAVGSLRSRQAVMVRPEVAGRIVKLGFDDGQAVQKGQLLVQLDDVLQQAELKQAQAQLSIAQANFNRNKDLVAQNFVAQRALDEAAANLDVARAQVQLAEARIKRMRTVSPFSGVVGIKTVSVGDYVKDGADVVNLEDIGAVFSDFRLPERLSSKISRGQKAEVSIDALPGKKFEAVVEAIDPQLDANGRSILVRARIDNKGGQLRSGMFARVRTVFGERVGALVVPEEALVPVGNKQFLIKVLESPDAKDKDGKPALISKRVEVKTGVRRGGRVEIAEGVSLGDTVVTAGQQRLQRDGAQVRVVDLSKPQGARPAAAAVSAASGAIPSISQPKAIPSAPAK
jgi:membrane fusion protein, multidrug efflux system